MQRSLAGIAVLTPLLACVASSPIDAVEPDVVVEQAPAPFSILAGEKAAPPEPVKLQAETRADVRNLATARSMAAVPAASSGLEIQFIDVGQGDSTLIKCPNGNNILVDAGRLPYSNPEDLREYLLEEIGGTKLDALVITHPDQDHYNALNTVLHDVEIGLLLMIKELGSYNDYFRDWYDEEIDGKVEVIGASSRYWDRPDSPNPRLDCGDAKIYQLAGNIEGDPGLSPSNAKSIVLLISFGDFDAILTGDATFDTEDIILRRYGGGTDSWLEAEILKVGHHGSSRTSTGSDWIQAVSPDVAIASSGYSNSYGHPRKSVMERLQEHTVDVPSHQMRWCEKTKKDTCRSFKTTEAIYNTGASGTIVVTTDGSSYTINIEK